MPGGGFPSPGLLRLEWEYYAVAPDRMEDLDDYFSVTAFPTTYFVDSEGRLLLEPVVGAKLDDYPQAMAEALAAVE